MLAATMPLTATDMADMQSWPVPSAPIEEMTYTPEATRFCLWSPKADSVQVILYGEASPLPTSPLGEEPGTAGISGNSGTARTAETARTARTAGTAGTAGNSETIPLSPQPDGTWTATIEGRDLKGTYYTFRVKAYGKWLSETPGIFAKAVSLNGKRAYITDMRTTNPVGWDIDISPSTGSQRDAIIYEMHHRDFSVHPSSGISNKGKFLALTESGTTIANNSPLPASPSGKKPASPGNSGTAGKPGAAGTTATVPCGSPQGLSTGLDHLRELGVTHIHLLPSYDFGSIDESTGLAIGGGGRTEQVSYNWGYDPVNYNVPEGSYSTDAATPETRIREFKEMVMALHNAGLRVVMDVVYNHVFDLERSPFHLTAPGYFFRYKSPLPTSPLGEETGKTGISGKTGTAGAAGIAAPPANGSGCGNETASERPMMRKFMVESVLYWMREYHIDGFRFDLMGIHDIATMNAIREAAQAVDPNVVIYGEGWAAESPALSNDLLAMKANTAQLGGIAAFGDEMRDGLRGGWQDDREGAFLIGKAGNEESVKFGIVGAIFHPDVDLSRVNYSHEAWAAKPTEMISYVSCHDDMCLADRLKVTLPNPTPEALARLQKLAYTAVLTSQGVPFIWCGDEIMRDKKGVHNSYASPDSINAIDWTLKAQHHDVFRYIQSLINMRKAHPAFRLKSAEDVMRCLKFLPSKQSNVIAWQLNGMAAGDMWGNIIVVLNSNQRAVKQQIPRGKWVIVTSSSDTTPKAATSPSPRRQPRY